MSAALSPCPRAGFARAIKRSSATCDGQSPAAPRHLIALPNDRRPQKREIAALVGAENLLRIEPGIAALGFLWGQWCRGGAPLQFGLVDQQIDPPLLHRQADAIAVAHQP